MDQGRFRIVFHKSRAPIAVQSTFPNQLPDDDTSRAKAANPPENRNSERRRTIVLVSRSHASQCGQTSFWDLGKYQGLLGGHHFSDTKLNRAPQVGHTCLPTSGLGLGARKPGSQARQTESASDKSLPQLSHRESEVTLSPAAR